MPPPTKYRRPVKILGTIHRGDNQAPVDCTVTEISESSALHLVPDADMIPKTFTLSFAGGNQVQRHCTVLSREHGQIAVVMMKTNAD
jgi:hypothetical protein